MPIISAIPQNPLIDGRQSERAMLVRRGVQRLLSEMGAHVLPELSLATGRRADLVAIGRPHMIDPMWTLRAAAQHGYRGVRVPPQYLGGMSQLARNLQRAAEAGAALGS